MNKKIRTSYLFSIAAILISLLSIYIQSFWHKESLTIYTTNLAFDKNRIHAEFVISNLGNHDEVIYKSFIGIENSTDIKDVDATDASIIIKPGESKKVLAVSPVIEFDATKYINFYIRLLSDEKLHKLKLAYYDMERETILYRLPKLDIHSISSAICGDCGNIKYDNEYHVKRGY